MPHTVSYEKIEKVDHILIRFDKAGEMKAVISARLAEAGGGAQRYTHEAKLRSGQKAVILGMIRDMGAAMDVDVPEYAKEKK